MIRMRSVIVLALVGALTAACRSSPSSEPPPQVPGGNAGRGAELISQFGCGSCHIIPGIPEADGLVGPPLIHFGRRKLIAGQISNTADNLVRWIRDPQSVEPGTAMPDLQVSEQQARDIAAYLFELE